MRHVIQFSGGIGSWATARLVKDTIMNPADELILLFADVLIEDRDTYEFIELASINLDTEITRICEGRTPWQVFHDKKFLGNTYVDPCSLYLKRIPLRRWIEDNCDPADSIIYFGIDWTEAHRFERLKPRWDPWRIAAPLIDERIDKQQMHMWARNEGLPEQRLYRMGMPHANCGGGCIKAAQGHWKKLLLLWPKRFAEWEANEEDMRHYLNRDVAMCHEVVHGERRPLPLAEIRRRVELQLPIDDLDIGGCGCALDD